MEVKELDEGGKDCGDCYSPEGPNTPGGGLGEGEVGPSNVALPIGSLRFPLAPSHKRNPRPQQTEERYLLRAHREMMTLSR